MGKEQKLDLREAWQTNKGVNNLDYVTGWHAKALMLLENRPGEFAFVTTNSITQGQNVPDLFSPIFEKGWRIKFAHRTFAWDSEAPGKAAVHCVIVGFTRQKTQTQKLWVYPHVSGKPELTKVSTELNAYLLDAPNVLIRRRNKPLSPQLPSISLGSMPVDSGNLIVEIDKLKQVQEDPIASKYLRPFKMGRELVRGLDRWCLWMADKDFDPQDLSRSKILKERVQAVQETRLASTRKATQESAKQPHLFQEIRQPEEPYVGIPRVVSESRRYYTVDYLEPHTIAGDKVYIAVDPSGLLFGLMSSSMFITWQKAVGGRLESRLNFSNTITWNNFPVPHLEEETKDAIISAGKKILEARNLRPERSLADHYQPLAMATELIRAHDQLDREVDKAFGSSRRLTTEKQRLECLFASYKNLIDASLRSTV